jgi:protein-disulfide isomerase
MKQTNRWAAAALLALSTAVAACSEQPAKAAQPAATTPAAASAEPPEVLATVGSEQITMADIRERAGGQLEQIEGTYQRQRTRFLESMLQSMLRERTLVAEAEKQGKTVERLVLEEAGGTFEPNDIEINAWYEDNQGRVGGRTLEQARPQIINLLSSQRRREATEKLEARLNKENNVTIHLQPYRVTLNNEGAPTAGKADAAVTLVEFSDFQCPFCARFVPTLKQIEAAYGDRVKIVYRQYPIVSLHPNAFKAAEASLCANEQGKFWQIHDMMFQEQAQLSIRELKVMANRLGLDQTKFDSCLDSGRYAEQIQNDLAEGSRAGMTGTPALFVNGIEIPGGAVPYENVARVLDRELARTN